VHESVGGVVKEYVYAQDGQELSVVDASQNLLQGETYFGGRTLATVGSAGTSYAHTDWLGTVRARTGPAGALAGAYTSGPFGENLSAIGGASSLHLTGKYRDGETGFDYFGARYYNSSLGRFLTPDPLGGDIYNPQSLNRYAYAWNNPTTMTDPTGMYVCSDAKENNGGCNSANDKKFAAALARDLKSKNKDALRAAQAYGKANEDNGVTVGFGKTADRSAANTDAGFRASPDGAGLQATASVEFENGLSGAALDAAVGHEGTHVANAQDFINTVSADATSFNAELNLTKYQNETSAYRVTAAILASEGVQLDYGTALNPAPLGAGVSAAGTSASIQTILANAPYKVTPANPGLPIYPAFTIPH